MNFDFLSWWDRFKARCAEILEAIENPFTLCELDGIGAEQQGNEDTNG